MPQSDENSHNSPEYVEAALPLPLRQTFTYRLPPGFRDDVKTGARLLLPFGKRSLTGYAVALHDELAPETGVEESAVKNVLQLLDETPLITDEILHLTKWTADYYAASWGEVLKASLPAGINAATEQLVSISESGRTELLSLSNLKPVKARILKTLSDSGEVPQRQLEKEFGEAATKRAVRDLAARGCIDIRQRSVTNTVKPKHRKAVRLIE